jgi:hypothetical protein
VGKTLEKAMEKLRTFSRQHVGRIKGTKWLMFFILLFCSQLTQVRELRLRKTRPCWAGEEWENDGILGTPFRSTSVIHFELCSTSSFVQNYKDL